MAREKITPEQAGQQEYEQQRRWKAKDTDRALIRDLPYARSTVAQREHLNKYRSAPHAEAKERAKLRAILDEIRSRRYATDTTVTSLFAQMTEPAPTEPVYPFIFTDSHASGSAD